MVVGQSPVSQQAAADALPLRDAFAVLFFVSVGMLFDPGFLLREPVLVLAALAVVLVGKPLVALVVVAALGYPARTGLVAALGLAQVGEFSFILGGLALDHGLLPAAGFNVVVACAIVSISINPFLFGWLEPLEAAARRRPSLWRRARRAGGRRGDRVSAGAGPRRPGTKRSPRRGGGIRPGGDDGRPSHPRGGRRDGGDRPQPRDGRRSHPGGTPFALRGREPPRTSSRRPASRARATS